MDFVEDDEPVGRERWIVVESTSEDSFGHDFDSGSRTDDTLVPSLITDESARLVSDELRDTACSRACSQPTRFQHDDATIVEPGFVEEAQRNESRLSCTGWSNQNC